MKPLPDAVRTFLAENHVVSLAACHGQDLWCASCFYVLDEAAARLIVLTAKTSRHGRLMLLNPQVAGTVAAQPARIRDIRGIQFAGRAECVEDPAERKAAVKRYAQAHPVAKIFQSDVWHIWLEQAKFTDNRILFGHKTHWQREEAGL